MSMTTTWLFLSPPHLYKRHGEMHIMKKTMFVPIFFAIQTVVENQENCAHTIFSPVFWLKTIRCFFSFSTRKENGKECYNRTVYITNTPTRDGLVWYILSSIKSKENNFFNLTCCAIAGLLLLKTVMPLLPIEFDTRFSIFYCFTMHIESVSSCIALIICNSQHICYIGFIKFNLISNKNFSLA